MSRVGKKPIPLPQGVKVTVGEQILVEGPKGKLTVPVLPGVRLEQENGTLEIRRDNDSFAAVHGLTRALTANAVTGVSTGFVRELDIVGIGYRAEMKTDEVISFSLGYSHPIEFVLPKGVSCKIDKQTHLTLSAIDKQELGQVAANIRSLRPPEPYKQKGIRYTGEVLRKKVGKTGAGGK
ncbi:MAG TPA: 50S ribosomal protein L6 [Bryobacteraceae bacterium]|nr:50S ribosomal protein L6 [Bryobacterales bacterium]HRJ19512.1 50S ribosomal protein L6 [Bryobacteraceae bacterium]